MESVVVGVQPAQAPTRVMADVREAMRRALVPFLVSRLIIVAILALVPVILAIPAEEWRTSDSISIKLNGKAIAEGLQRLAHANDAGWYTDIARNGYEQRPFDTTKQANWAFFPLHPYLWRGAAAVTGEWVWSGIVLANALSFLGLSLLWLLVRRLTDSGERADDAVLFAAFWPSAYFMVLPHTESLFFAAVTLSFLAAKSQRWWLAGLAGMFAGATRLNGLFLMPALFARWWHSPRRAADLLMLAPIGFGLLAFSLYLWGITGNALAFKDIQVTWGRELTMPWVALLDYLDKPLRVASPWNPKVVHFGATVLAIASIVTCWRRGWRGLAVFTALTLMAPLLTGTLMSMTRYLGVAPGVFVALSVWAGESRRVGQLCLVVSGIALTLLCTAFAAGLNLGGA
ncbi:hypothetical protein QLQ15_06450 [Lysobacter sp. LF1]|uniref:Glycosyltransferase RgtA/B/C/D-like domain-containing protein n=1 Tax=Lysobacter stagni TaxID=3045172 RepID=A0ABT6XEJ8_9GAMM|nr:hypothetical protein [Lysobacter sp. LF1]MDI9238553.1 hypothetical protein [Lysobacter sp. LF1]